jgi:hypothetical protein
MVSRLDEGGPQGVEQTRITQRILGVFFLGLLFGIFEIWKFFD